MNKKIEYIALDYCNITLKIIIDYIQYKLIIYKTVHIAHDVEIDGAVISSDSVVAQFTKLNKFVSIKKKCNSRTSYRDR